MSWFTEAPPSAMSTLRSCRTPAKHLRCAALKSFAQSMATLTEVEMLCRRRPSTCEWRASQCNEQLQGCRWSTGTAVTQGEALAAVAILQGRNPWDLSQMGSSASCFGSESNGRLAAAKQLHLIKLHTAHAVQCAYLHTEQSAQNWANVAEPVCCALACIPGWLPWWRSSWSTH